MRLLIIFFSIITFPALAQNNEVAKELNRYSKREMKKILHEATYGKWVGEQDTVLGIYTLTLRKPNDGSFDIPPCGMVIWDIGKRVLGKAEYKCIREEPPLECVSDCEFFLYDLANPYRWKLHKTRLGFILTLRSNDGSIERLFLKNYEEYCCEFPQSVLTLVRLQGVE